MCYRLKNDDFFDEISKTVYDQLVERNSFVYSRVMLNIERFKLGQSYVTAKVQNRMARMSLLTYKELGWE